MFAVFFAILMVLYDRATLSLENCLTLTQLPSEWCNISLDCIAQWSLVHSIHTTSNIFVASMLLSPMERTEFKLLRSIVDPVPSSAKSNIMRVQPWQSAFSKMLLANCIFERWSTVLSNFCTRLFVFR